MSSHIAENETNNFQLFECSFRISCRYSAVVMLLYIRDLKIVIIS